MTYQVKCIVAAITGITTKELKTKKPETTVYTGVSGFEKYN